MGFFRLEERILRVSLASDPRAALHYLRVLIEKMEPNLSWIHTVKGQEVKNKLRQGKF